MNTNLNRVTLMFCAALAIPFAAQAGGGAAGGGSTELTQLQNNTELIAQVGEAVNTTSNTLMTAQSTMQQLRQLSPDMLAKMTGLPIDQVQKMAQAYEVMNKASGVYKDAAAVLEKARNDAINLNVSPSELLRMKAEVAAAYGGQYQQVYEQEQAKLRRLADVSADVQKQAETVKGIDANVKGIQVLANQNVKMQALLTGLNESISTANAMAAQVAAQVNGEQVQGARDAARSADAYRAAIKPAIGVIPLPGEIKLTK